MVKPDRETSPRLLLPLRVESFVPLGRPRVTVERPPSLSKKFKIERMPLLQPKVSRGSVDRKSVV